MRSDRFTIYVGVVVGMVIGLIWFGDWLLVIDYYYIGGIGGLQFTVRIADDRA